MPAPLGAFQSHVIRLLSDQARQAALHSGTCYHISLRANCVGCGLCSKDSWTVANIEELGSRGWRPEGGAQCLVSRDNKGYKGFCILSTSESQPLASANNVFQGPAIH